MENKNIHQISDLKCCVFGCEGSTFENVTNFYFPKDNERRKEWLTRIGRLNLLENDNIKGGIICLKHFEDRYKILRGKKLSSDAIPTLFIPYFEEITTSEDSFSITKSEIDIIDVLNESLCRTCLSKSDLFSVFDENNELQISYSEMLQFCISIHVKESDNYPKYICLKCAAELIRLYSFVNLCRDTEKQLNKLQSDEIISDNYKTDSSSDEYDFEEKTDFKNEIKDLDLEYIFFGSKKPDLNELPPKKQKITEKIETITSESQKAINEIFKIEHDYSINEIHENKESFSLYKCDWCKKMFNSIEDVSLHCSNEHKNVETTFFQDENYFCQICDTLLSNNEEYNNHMMLHKDDNLQSTIKFSKVDVSRPKNFQCPICKIRLDCQRRLDIHMRKHTGEQPFLCTICGKTFKHEESLERHAPKHPGYIPKKPFMCDICHRPYRNQDKLNIHMKLVHTKLPENSCFGCRKTFKTIEELDNHDCNAEYKCLYCVRKFRIKKEMYEHIRLTHLKPYVCIYCGEAFIVKKSLDIHYLTHDMIREKLELMPENGFECPICEENFENLIILIEHEKTHTTKTYNCKDCNEEFYSEHLFNTHAKTKHKLALFTCKICQKQFSNICGLNAHKENHKNDFKHVCEYCGRKFSLKKKLTSHMLTHSNNGDNFPCNLCGKTFRAKAYLSRHLWTHSNNRRYVCHCGAAFNENSHLKRHIKTNACKRYSENKNKVKKNVENTNLIELYADLG